MVSVTILYCYAWCRYAEGRYAECRNAECRYSECCNDECRVAFSIIFHFPFWVKNIYFLVIEPFFI
jgi:hypothetical protein